MKKVFFSSIICNLLFTISFTAQVDNRYRDGNAERIRAEGKNDKEGKPDGEWKYYYKSNKLASVGKFNHGLKNGEWIDYFDNGNVRYKKNYKNGIIDGNATSYFESGKLECEHYFCNGKSCKTWYHYYENNGKVYRKIIMDTIAKDSLPFVYCYEKNGLRYFEGFCKPFSDVTKCKNGTFFDYNKKGKLYQKRIINDSTEEWITYYKSGKVKGDFMMMNGLNNGITKVYYANGKLEIEAVYINGYRDGEYKDYYKNGQIRMDAIISNNEKNIIGTIYKKSGEIKSKGVILNGELISLEKQLVIIPLIF